MVICGNEFAMTHVMNAADKAAAAGDAPALCQALRAARALMVAAREMQNEFFRESGAKRCVELLGSMGSRAGVTAALCRAADAATHKFENNKCAFYDQGFVLAAVDVLRRGEYDDETCKAIANLLGNTCQNDDVKAPGSRAFAIGVELGSNTDMGEVILGALRRETAGAGDEAVVCSLLRCVQRTSVNSDISGKFAEMGGLDDALRGASANGATARVLTATFKMLGQVTGNDDIRLQLVSKGLLELVPAVCAAFPSDPKVLEPALRVTGMVLLRNPDAAARAHGAGVLDAAVRAILECPGEAGVCRQVCQVVRNAVVRTPSLRDVLLAAEDGGLEAALRKARIQHADCKDVGGAALRDLGLEYHGDTEKNDGSLDYYYSAL